MFYSKTLVGTLPILYGYNLDTRFPGSTDHPAMSALQHKEISRQKKLYGAVCKNGYTIQNSILHLKECRCKKANKPYTASDQAGAWWHHRIKPHPMHFPVKGCPCSQSMPLMGKRLNFCKCNMIFLIKCQFLLTEPWSFSLFGISLCWRALIAGGTISH